MKDREKDASSATSKYMLVLMGLVLMMIWPIARWFAKVVSEESHPRRLSAANGRAHKDGSMETRNNALILIPNETWAVPKPDSIPQRTYWPAMLALGIVFFCFGIVAEYVFVLVGLALMIWSIGHWVVELVNEE